MVWEIHLQYRIENLEEKDGDYIVELFDGKRIKLERSTLENALNEIEVDDLKENPTNYAVQITRSPDEKPVIRFTRYHPPKF